MKKVFIIRLVCLFILFFGSSSLVLADIAPPLQPSGGNLDMLEFQETMVEMSYEVIFVDIGEVSNLFYTDLDFESVNAHVTALFLMVNRGEGTEKLETVFPLTHPGGMGDSRFDFPEIRNFTISVNDTPVEWYLKETPNQYYEEFPPVKWAAFDVEYPPGETMAVEVSYDVQSTGYFPEATFYYVLETGAGWYGPIGEAIVYMTLPYQASDEIFLFGNHNMMGFDQKTSPNLTYDGNKARWQFTDFEPQPRQNWEATIIEPNTWQEVLNIRERIDAGDKLAYSEITMIYDYIVMGRGVRRGAEDFVQLNLDMYEKALAYEPNNDDVYARYADFLLFLDWVSSDELDVEFDLWDAYDAAVHALSINEYNETANRVKRELEKFKGFDPENRDQVATETPEATDRPAPVIEETTPEVDEDVSAEVVESQGDAVSEDKNEILYLAGGIVLTAAVGIWLFQRRLRKKDN